MRIHSKLGLVIALLLVTSAAPVCGFQKPVQVYILVGQSNMEGHAHRRVLDYLGDDPATAGLLTAIRDESGGDREIPHTWISYLTGQPATGKNRVVSGPLRVGYGSLGRQATTGPGDKIGPELAFGVTMQKSLDQPILLIKAAWGGQSLHTDFRPPSSGEYPLDETKQKRFDTPEKIAAMRKKTGARYRQMLEHVQRVLKDIGQYCPEYDPQAGYELAGFVWFQGWNDMVDRGTYPNRDQPGGYGAYSECLVHFIRDVRRDLEAPHLPFVIGVMGVEGPIAPGEETKRRVHQEFRYAMSVPTELPEFAGNVVAVPTAPYWDEALAAIGEKRNQVNAKRRALERENKQHENADGTLDREAIQAIVKKLEEELISPAEVALEARGKSNAGYHYLGSAKTYSLIGEAFARALISMRDASGQ